MTDPIVPSNGGGAPALPSFLRSQTTQDYDSMRLAPPPALYGRVNRDGVITIKRGADDVVATMQNITGIVVGYSLPRVMWFDENSIGGKPDCSSPNGKTGEGTCIVAAGETSPVPDGNGNNPVGPTVVTRACGTCPLSQFGSGNGNSQKCKQTIRFALYIPTDNGNAPWLESFPGDPVIFSISPSNIRDWDAHITWLQSFSCPIDGAWTKLTGEQTSGGGFSYGKITFAGSQPLQEDMKYFWDQAQAMKTHPLVASINEAGGSQDYIIDV